MYLSESSQRVPRVEDDGLLLEDLKKVGVGEGFVDDDLVDVSEEESRES